MSEKWKIHEKVVTHFLEFIGFMVLKIPQSGNMQHPICGTETYDYFFGVESSIARVFITSEGGHILKPSLSPPICSFTNCYHLNDHPDEIVYFDKY